MIEYRDLLTLHICIQLISGSKLTIQKLILSDITWFKIYIFFISVSHSYSKQRSKMVSKILYTMLWSQHSRKLKNIANLSIIIVKTMLYRRIEMWPATRTIYKLENARNQKVKQCLDQYRRFLNRGLGCGRTIW